MMKCSLKSCSFAVPENIVLITETTLALSLKAFSLPCAWEPGELTQLPERMCFPQMCFSVIMKSWI